MVLNWLIFSTQTFLSWGLVMGCSVEMVLKSVSLLTFAERDVCD